MPQTFSPIRRRLLLGGAGLALSGLAPHAAFARQPALPLTQAVLDRWVAENRVPGATVGIRFGEAPPVFIQAGSPVYGGAPADADSLFRIYSMTKPITGVAAALLIEDGVLTLDTPVTDFIPEFAALRVAADPAHSLDSGPVTTPMTIRHLLTHTAGLSYHFMDDGPVSDAYRKAGVFPVTGYNLAPKPEIDAPMVRDLDEMVRRLADIPLRFQPGSAFHYSVGLDVLGLVIQRASGLSFPDFIQRRLLNPIGMADTVWSLRPGDAARFASVSSYEADGARTLIDGPADSSYAGPITLFSGGAGLVSSTRDYLAFLSTVLNDGRAGGVQVMRPQTARLIHTDIMPAGLSDDDGSGYGFGGYVRRTPDPETGAAVGSWGWGGAAGTKAWIDPASGLAAVMMVQYFAWGFEHLTPDFRPALMADLNSGAQ